MSDLQSNPRHKKRRGRLLGLLATGGLLVLLAAGYNNFYLQRPIGQGPAGPAVAAAPFAEIWTERPVVLLGIGDSITAGLGARSPQHTYFQRLVENPADEYADMLDKSLGRVLPQLSTKNIAVSGSTSLQHMDYLQALEPFPAEAFGLVVITTGGNDIIHNYGRTPAREGAMYGATLEQAQPWIKNFAERLELMLDNVQALFPGGCEIYLADIYDPTDGVGDAPSIFLEDWPDGLAIHAAYNQALVAAAAGRAHVHTVPLHATFLGHGAHCCQFWRAHYDSSDPHYWFYNNVEDPNDRGYDAIRRVFLNEIVNHTTLRQAAQTPAADDGTAE